MYGRADGMPSSLQSVVVCDNYSHVGQYIAVTIGYRTKEEMQNTPGINRWFSTNQPLGGGWSKQVATSKQLATRQQIPFVP
jgi:hypothetical protein